MTTSIRRVYLFALLCAGCLFASCAGPERQPEGRTRLDDIGKEANEAYADKQREAKRLEAERLAAAGNAEDPSWQDMTAKFADDLIARTADTQGAIAVFPPFLRTTATNRWSVSDVGDRIAFEVAQKLERAGRRVLSGQALEQAIHDSNRGLDSIQDEASAIGMAGRLSGIFFVGAVSTGTIEITDRAGLSGARRVAFTLGATNLRDGSTLTRADLRVSNAVTAAAMAEELERKGRWRIGADAPPFTPSVDREFDVLATAALARILDRRPELVMQRRVAVLPLEAGATAAAARQLAPLQQAIAKAIDAAERRAQDEGKSDPLQTALDGPLTVLGRTYGSGNEALIAYNARRAELLGSGAGELCSHLADSMGQTLRAIAGDQVEIVAADDRRLAVSLVQADMLEFQTDHSIDAGSIGEVDGKAADVVVRTMLQQRINDYVMTVRIFDLKDPNHGHSEPIVLEPWLATPIRARLSGR